MPIDRKRRIFRASSLGAAGVQTIVPAAALLLLVIGGMALLSGRAAPFGQAPVPETILHAEPQAVAVVDAATLRLADTVVRLRGVVAPARGRQCRGTDGQGFDCGAAAAEALAALVRDRPVACQIDGRDGSGVREATCQAGETELNRAVIAAGWAHAQGGASDLRAAESAARAAGSGLWRATGSAASF